MQHNIVTEKIQGNLTAQKRCLTEYLAVLDHEATDIANKDADRLQSHIRLESSIVSEINAYRKVLNPLEEMYQQSAETDDCLDELRLCIMSLTDKVKQKSDENKKMLEKTLSEMQSRIDSLPKASKSRSSYSDVNAMFIDITL